jgi:glycosyltransferase domain-containing protein
MSARLTIVMPLRGRPLFTLRFLWHANAARLPYRFILADGQVRPALAGALENSRKIFPEIDVEYIRYPDDTNFGSYFLKMFDAMKRVETPYAMFVDNDDFLAFTGIERSLDFLEANPDYVCCGGGIAGLSAYIRKDPSLGGLVGPLNKLSFRYMPYDRSLDINSSSATERLLRGLRNSWSWYAVYRTPALLTVRREAAEMSLSDLQLHEKFCAMRTLTLGKARSDITTIAYLRQYWTSLQYPFSHDWVHHLVRSRFNTDFAEIIGRISAHAGAADAVDPAIVSEKLLGDMIPWFSDFLVRSYGPYAALRRYLRTRVPGLLIWAKTRRRYSVPLERRKLLAKLRQYGAPEDYMQAFSKELAQIEDVICGSAFANFIRPYVPLFSSEIVDKPAAITAPLAASARGQGG